MPWVKLDDNFFGHPKVDAAGRGGIELFVRSLSYSAHYLTDGFVSVTQIRMLTKEPDPIAVADDLCSVGLFEHADGGYRIHDYLDYNPSAAQVKAQREREAQRQAEWRGGHRPETPQDEQSNTASNAVTNTVTNAVTNTAPVPGPDPDPDPVPEPIAAPGEEARADARETLEPTARPARPPDPLFEAIAKLCKLDILHLPSTTRGQINRARKLVTQAGAEPCALDGFDIWWYANDWRGKKGQPPAPMQIAEVYARFCGAEDWERRGLSPSSIPVQVYQ